MTDHFLNVRPDYQAMIAAERKARRRTHLKFAFLNFLDNAIYAGAFVLVVLAVIYHVV